jgi:hypothetical protein
MVPPSSCCHGRAVPLVPVQPEASAIAVDTATAALMTASAAAGELPSCLLALRQVTSNAYRWFCRATAAVPRPAPGSPENCSREGDATAAAAARVPSSAASLQASATVCTSRCVSHKRGPCVLGSVGTTKAALSAASAAAQVTNGWLKALESCSGDTAQHTCAMARHSRVQHAISTAHHVNHVAVHTCGTAFCEAQCAAWSAETFMAHVGVASSAGRLQGMFFVRPGRYGKRMLTSLATRVRPVACQCYIV